VTFPVLTTLIILPLAGAIATTLVSGKRVESVRIIGQITALATLGVTLWMLADFGTGRAGYQFLSDHSWSSDLGIRWIVGVDGISLFMVVLNAILTPIALLASQRVEVRAKAFTAWILVLEAALMGAFLSLDLVLFFVFFELSLVPMYFLIAGWGHGRRQYAAMKFFIYTMAGSAFLLVGILTVAYLHRDATGLLTFDIRVLQRWAPAGLAPATAAWLFAAFTIAFAVKVPLFPLHTWLPDAHTEAPTAGSVILAGLMLKLGTYGFLRFVLPLFPDPTVRYAWVLLTLSVIGIIYGAIVAAMQPDLKRLIAYSSIAHLGFVVLGIFALTQQGLDGAIFTMLSHGLTTGVLFLIVGFLYERRHTRLIADFGGLWKAAPVMGGLFVMTAFASVGLPGFSGFVGEFLALLGAFLTHRWFAVVAASGVILAAVYLLWAVQRVFTGVPEGENATIRDLSVRELTCVVPLLGLSLFLGFYPRPVLDRIGPSVKAVVTHIERSTGYEAPSPSAPEAEESPAGPESEEAE
jgi:NADH-quinone oxidoreductase subunit M